MSVLLGLIIATVTIKTLPLVLQMVYTVFEKMIDALDLEKSEKQTIKKNVKFFVDGLSDIANVIDNTTSSEKVKKTRKKR